MNMPPIYQTIIICVIAAALTLLGVKHILSADALSAMFPALLAYALGTHAISANAASVNAAKVSPLKTSVPPAA